MDIDSQALRFTIGLLVLAAQPAAEQQIGPPAPKIVQEPGCEDEPADGDEIVVCGRADDEDSPYRLPREFRDLPSHDDRDASHAARQRDLDALDQYGSQTVGPSGALQRSRQTDCEWRAARQEAQGRRPDCTRRNRPDEATDWQRR